MMHDITIIGGGIVGLSTAYQLSEKLKDKGLKFLVLEKENELAFHQTGHNSGVIHSGIYYKPGSLKATNCIRGRKMLTEFADKNHISYDVCGKVIVAGKESEVPYLDEIFHNGNENGTEGLEIIDSRKIKEIEPYCEGVKGIWVPGAGIIDYKAVAKKYAELFEENGGKIVTNHKVIGTKRDVEGSSIHVEGRDTMYSKYVIYCGGSQSDRLAINDNQEPGMRIVGFRGEYYELVNHEKVNNLIYPVPNPSFPWLGVHFTRMIDGTIECGPNAVFAFKRDGYRKTDFNFKDTKDAVTYNGFWKLITSNIGYGIKEQWRSVSKRAFLSNLQQLIPSLKMKDIKPGRAGVRALALAPDGSMIDDFKILESKRSIHVLNAPSPAATASMAIGDSISDMALARFEL